MSEASKLHLATTELSFGCDLDEFVAIFAYAGFNPEMVHEHFSKIATEKKIELQELLKDIRVIITLGAMKGNYTIKNSAKISDKGKSTADGLYAKYQLKKGSVGNDRKSITLPRILSAFPELTAKIVLRCPDKNFGTRTGGLSKIIKSPVFAAILPQTLPANIKAFFLELYNIYCAEQTLTISSETDFKLAFEKQMQFTDIAHHSSVPAESSRIELFKKSTDVLKQDVTFGLTIDIMKNKISTDNLVVALDKL